MQLHDTETRKTFEIADEIGQGLLKMAPGRYLAAGGHVGLQDVISPRTGKPKRAYKRRDMRAEGEK